MREAGTEVHEPNSPGGPAVDDGLNDRQRRILEKIDSGEDLQQKDVIAMFRRHWNPSTIKRELKGLRDMRKIETYADEYYLRESPRSRRLMRRMWT